MRTEIHVMSEIRTHDPSQAKTFHALHHAATVIGMLSADTRVSKRVRISYYRSVHNIYLLHVNKPTMKHTNEN